MPFFLLNQLLRRGGDGQTGTEPYVQSAAVTSRMMMVKNKGGWPRFEPTEEQRKNVEIMVGGAGV